MVVVVAFVVMVVLVALVIRSGGHAAAGVDVGSCGCDVACGGGGGCESVRCTRGGGCVVCDG